MHGLSIWAALPCPVHGPIMGNDAPPTAGMAIFENVHRRGGRHDKLSHNQNP